MIIKRNVPVNDHSLQRLKERYGCNVNRHLTNTLLQKIIKGKAKLIETCKYQNRKIYSVFVGKKLNKKEFTVVVSKELNHIITFLPNDCKK